MIQFVKYGLVGGVNFIITVGLFLFLLKVLLVNYLISFTITWLFGIFLTYVINFLWVFKPEDKLEFKKRFPKYFSVYLFSYLVNIGLLKYLVSIYEFDPFYIQFAILPLVVFINFFGFKYWGLK
jgi:putative flippase GtrA